MYLKEMQCFDKIQKVLNKSNVTTDLAIFITTRKNGETHFFFFFTALVLFVLCHVFHYTSNEVDNYFQDLKNNVFSQFTKKKKRDQIPDSFKWEYL